MRIASSSLELVGQTPIQILNRMSPQGKASIWAKMEIFSPGSCVKDRIGVWMVQDAIQKGKIKPGGTFIEATAGNTGVGVALAASALEYKFICVMPETYSQEKQQLVEMLGGIVVRTPLKLGMKGSMQKALELEKEIPNSLVTRQYENPANPECHYKTTGPEIWEQTNGKITHFVTGVGSGGTFTGISRFLKEKNPQIKTYMVEPQGSILGGGEAGPHWKCCEGIGSDFFPEILDTSLSDGVITVEDEDIKRTVQELALKEQILAGGSSAAHVFAAQKIARELPEDALVVTMICDRMERYISKGILKETCRDN
jgi:O-acetylserine dependent cystathionine beta-synthase